MTATDATVPSPPQDFIRTIVTEDLASGKHTSVVTRFPPEPNGHLHIGHAKSICLNFGVATEFGGVCHLRFDDTNPLKEREEFMEAIEEDIRWLGFEFNDKLFHASDCFEQLYAYAEQLITEGKAYVCSLTAEQIREYRGTLKEPGRASPYRDRGVEENLDLFRRMRAGEFEDGAHVLRAKIDMASPNINMRDPTIYRIRRVPHQRTGDAWSVYPMYDYAHCVSDSIEGITHSLCTLEFEDHRPLYDWILDELRVDCHPRQIEFARLNLAYHVMSKRKLLELVEEGRVDGWDDPRMPTLAGMRRRGFPPEAVRAFCDRAGVTKRDQVMEPGLLEHSVRDALNPIAPRVMGVLRPLKVVIDNYPEGQVEELEAPYHPDDAERLGSRRVPFARELFIERDDFMEDPPRKFFRLAPGREVRLRWAYLVTCDSVEKDADGNVTVVHCTYDPATRGGSAPDGRKVKGTMHWVAAEPSLPAEVRLYESLFTKSNPAEGPDDYHAYLNPESKTILTGCRVEPSLADATPGHRCQFERQGYFCVDPDSEAGALVFNRTVPLRDSWAKIAKQAGGPAGDAEASKRK
ncbi:MAG: glutamine--tRNA ligase/YqeY domain fusion protein [Planctomycetes bacterium]|nr:glutamine--tRNA ligase/YqeY domain fusion protein [Planctomycetota bacterium]